MYLASRDQGLTKSTLQRGLHQQLASTHALLQFRSGQGCHAASRTVLTASRNSQPGARCDTPALHYCAALPMCLCRIGLPEGVSFV